MKGQTQTHTLAGSDKYTIKFVSITHIQARTVIQRFIGNTI